MRIAEDAMMDRFPTILFVLWFISIPQTILAADRTTIALASDDINEVVREGALISGGVIVGVQVQNLSNEGPSLSGYVPKAWGGKSLCARVISADGLYEGNAPYVIPDDWNGGITNFAFPTKYAELLRSLPQDGLGILLSQGKCGAQNIVQKSVAFWNAEDFETVSILVNAFQADSVFAYVGTQPSPILCDRLENGKGTAFNAKCALPVDLLTPPAKIEIYRVVSGKPSQPTSLEVWLPAGG